MNIVLFDSILEKHTVESLVRAMKAVGHQVVWTGAIWRGHSLPTDSGDLEMIQRHVDEICSLRPDALFNFRASTLLPAMVRQLRDAGITTMVWLPDDPVLYDICYREIVDSYDVWLHCGNEQVLEFYRSRHGRCGVNFPFWTDEVAFPFSFAPEKAEIDLIFLGNCVGPVRLNRYDLISNLPFRTRILGNVHNDPHNICAGYFEETEMVARELGKSLCGINIPQYFKDYADSVYDFPELGSLGHFQFPSRVIQYAAVGLPIFSLEPENSSKSLFPEVIRVADRDALIKQADLLLDKDRIKELSKKTHERFHQCFSAASRTAFLEQIIGYPEEMERMSLRERASAFAYAVEAKRSVENPGVQSNAREGGPPGSEDMMNTDPLSISKEKGRQSPCNVSVVVPVFNSEPLLPLLVSRLQSVLDSVASAYELILVNDGSSDGSWEVITSLAGEYPWIHGINLMRQYGQHNGLLCGIRAAKYEVVVTMDDDLQQPPEEIPKLLDKLAQGYDVVYGAPMKRKHGFWRNSASYLTRLALQSVTGIATARDASSFRVFRTQLRGAFANFQGAFVSIDVLLSWGTKRFGFVPVKHDRRRIGTSNYTFFRLMAHGLNMLTGFSAWPLRLASLVGFGFTFLGIIVFLYTVGRYLIEGGSVPGFPFLASIIAIFSGGQLFALGIIGEYLGRIHFSSMGRPSSLIRETTGSPPHSNREQEK